MTTMTRRPASGRRPSHGGAADPCPRPHAGVGAMVGGGVTVSLVRRMLMMPLTYGLLLLLAPGGSTMVGGGGVVTVVAASTSPAPVMVTAAAMQDGGGEAEAEAAVRRAMLPRLKWDMLDAWRQKLLSDEPASAWSNMSSVCKAQMEVLDAHTADIHSQKHWAMAAVDAWGVQQGSAVYEGNLNHLGSVEECRRIKATGDTVTNANGTFIHDFGVKYCRMFWTAVPETRFKGSQGMCVPAGCNDQDIYRIFYAQDTRWDASEHPAQGLTCVDEDPAGAQVWSDPAAILAIVVCLVVMVIIVVASIVDYLRETRTKQVIDSRKQSDVTHENGIALKADADRDNITNAEAATESLTTERKPPLKPNKCLQILLCFSLWTNAPEVFSAKVGPRATYHCMNGIRFFTFSWILLGHSWQIGITLPLRAQNVDNMFAVQERISKMWTFQAIINMNYAVETFFVMSGALAMMSLLRFFNKVTSHHTQARYVFLSYLHRYLRLFVVYGAIMIMFMGFYPYMGTPTSWQKHVHKCKANIWTTILCVPNRMCMRWGWYMAMDMWFFLGVPLFAYAIVRKRPVGIALIAICGAVSAAIRLGMHIHIHSIGGESWSEIYFAAWCRYSTYAIGMGLGVIMYHTKCKNKLKHKGVIAVCWAVSMLLLLITVYGPLFAGSTGWQLFHVSVSRDLMALSVSWIIFACCYGYGGPINGLLSWKLFIPLSRLTYTGYLIHPIINYWHASLWPTTFHVNQSTMLMYYSGTLLLTLGASLVMHLAFEVPGLKLQELLLPPRALKKNN